MDLAQIIGWSITPGSGRFRGTVTITAPNARRFRLQGNRRAGRQAANAMMRQRGLALCEPRDVAIELPEGVQEIERRRR